MGKSPKTGKKRRKSDIEKLQARYKVKYDSWGKSVCPILNNSEVQYTNEGWDHLYVRKKRSKVQLESRFLYLTYAKRVIESPNTKIRGWGWKDGHRMCNLVGEWGGVKIVVDISKTKNGYIFFSHHREGR